MRRTRPKRSGHVTALLFGETRTHALENRPQDLALLAADAGLATEPGDIAGRILPDLRAAKRRRPRATRRSEIAARTGALNLGGRLAQQRLDQRRRGDVRLAERRRDRGRMPILVTGCTAIRSAISGSLPVRVRKPDAQRICQRPSRRSSAARGLAGVAGPRRPPGASATIVLPVPAGRISGGAVVFTLDEPPLRRVQEDRPFVPRVIERAFEFLDIRQHAEPALRVGMSERIGLDRRPFRHLRCCAGRQVQQRLGSLLRQPLGDVEQGVLVGPADLVEPFRRHAIAEQRVVGDPGEQQRLG